jgi:sigma54-dependent transcription regulator
VYAERRTWKRTHVTTSGEALLIANVRRTRLRDVIERAEVVAAHRELVEASDAVRHLLAVEDLTQERIDDARDRLARAYERTREVDGALLRV